MENYDDFNNSDSIFEDNSPEFSSKPFPNDLASDEKYKSHLNNSFIYKILDSISEKMGEIAQKNKIEREIKSLQKYADKKFAGREEILKLFKSFGCHLTIMDKYVDFTCEQFNLKGKITFDKNQNAVFDEDTMRIFRIIANIIHNSNGLEDVINEYEKLGFYPIGELEQQTITVEGQQREVMAGILQNQQGEQKKIYFSNGKEVFPDK